jgi:ribosomal protein L37E
MSDERYVNGNQTLEINRNWSVAGTHMDTPSLKKRDLSSGALGFGRVLLFSPRVESIGVISKNLAEYKSCEVCGMSLHKSARFCSSCGIPVNRDNSYENSW